MSSRIGTFRRKVALGQYEVTGHAKDEMEQDGFNIADVKSAIYTGRIIMMQRAGQAARKFVVRGKSVDGRQLDVVCRLTEWCRLLAV